MKCFSVCEIAELGLIAINQPLDGEIADPAILIGHGNSCTRVGVSRDQRDFYTKMLLAQIPLTRLLHAEIAHQPPFRLVKGRPNQCGDQCIVHIATAAGVGGHLWYEANTFEEIEEEVRGRPRVVRAYNFFSPSPGIEVLAIGHGENGEPHALLRMVPGASFRICRNGELPGLSPVLIVAWTGSVLRVFPPKRYASLQETSEASAAA